MMYVPTQLDELASLLPNWDSYGGLPIEPEILAAARELFWKFPVNTPDVHVTPLSEGSLMFEWHCNGKDLELEFDTPEDLEYWKRQDDFSEHGNVSVSDLLKIHALIGWLTG